MALKFLVFYRIGTLQTSFPDRAAKAGSYEKKGSYSFKISVEGRSLANAASCKECFEQPNCSTVAWHIKIGLGVFVKEC